MKILIYADKMETLNGDVVAFKVDRIFVDSDKDEEAAYRRVVAKKDEIAGFVKDIINDPKAKSEIVVRDKKEGGDSKWTIERVIRDAIVDYNEMFPNCPNDDCERDLRERARVANEWLKSHGYEEEKFYFAEEKKDEEVVAEMKKPNERIAVTVEGDGASPSKEQLEAAAEAAKPAIEAAIKTAAAIEGRARPDEQ